MGWQDGLRRQLRSVVEWKNPPDDLIFEQWSDNGDEIKRASKLLVNPGQGCIFVYEGKVKAMIVKPGLISLDTTNIPFWTTIKKFMQFFESEHKVGLYYFRYTKFLDQKWGTKALIKYEDPKYKFPVRLRAFGNYSFRIIDPRSFFVNVMSTSASYDTAQFREVMNNRILQPITDYLATARFSYAEIDANREEVAADVLTKTEPLFHKLGFALTDFRIEGTTFDDDTNKRINRIADIMAESQAATAAGLDYAGLQQLEALREAARNEGGAAGIGMGVGAGMGFGQMMAGQMGGGMQQQQHQQQTASDPMSALKTLKQLHEDGLINDDEYAKKKQEILSRL
jgi:membrane protease subunit (stomatin/prohibitin family)